MSVQIWFQNRRMKGKRQKLVMSWAAVAPLHHACFSLAALRHAHLQYSYAGTSPQPLHYHAGWELQRAAALTAAAYSARLISAAADNNNNNNNIDNSPRRNYMDDGFNLTPVPRHDDDVTPGSRDRVATTTTASLFRPYNLSA